MNVFSRSELRFLCRTGLIATAVLFTGLAHAQIANPTVYLVASNTDSLYTLNVNTGVATLVGALNGTFTNAEGSDLAAYNGELFAIDLGDVNNNFASLTRVDRLTAATSLIPSAATDLNFALAIDGNGIFYSHDAGTLRVDRFNSNSGFANSEFSTTPTVEFLDGLAFNRGNGLLYGINETGEFVSINPNSGVLTTINANVGGAGTRSDLEFVGDTLYWVTGTNSGTLYTLDVTTGNRTFVANIVDTSGNTLVPDGLAAAPALPEPSSLWLSGSGLLLALAVARRRRH